jgi:predicted double-glycine peptidase
MNPWLETLLALLAILLSFAAGFFASRLPRHWWLVGYVPPLMVVVAFAVAIRRPDVAMQPWLAWIFVGRWKTCLMGSVVALLLATLIPRLGTRRDRVALLALTVAATGYVGIWPSAAAAVSRPYLASLKTQVGTDGVCRQSTDYTCGPAAAVTGLRRLGLPAEEGELAVLAHTSTASGTPPDVLCAVLNERYGPQGLRAKLGRFRDASELRGLGPTLVIVRFSLLLDHWLCVLEVTDREVVVGDPLNGLNRLTHAEFNERWRHIGVTLSRP